MRILSVAVAALVASGAFAQWQSEGKPVPDNEWRKSSGTLGAMLEFTDKPAELFAAWNKPGEYVQVPGSTDTTYTNHLLVGVVFFTGCKPNAEGTCDATVDYVVHRPDGSVYGDLKGGDLWKNKPAPAIHSVQLAVQPLGVRIEPTDPVGEYVVTATVHDLNANITMVLNRSFHVEASETGATRP
jgi:hypothetical protein